MSVPEITPEELLRRLEAGERVHILDVRAAERLESGRIDVVEESRFHNVTGSTLLAAADPEALGLPRDEPLAVVCGHGNASKRVTSLLSELGYRAWSVAGGMARWMHTVVPRELPPEGLDRLVQFDRVGKGALGYLLVSGGEALVIDPPRNTEPYERVAREAGARIVAVADTHVHADYISGAPDLALRLGVPYLLHPADSSYPYDGTPGRLSYQPLADGDIIRLGNAEVRVWHTPGHTTGSVSFTCGRLAITGDFLFVRSIGRPDLAGKSAEWTGLLWSSVERVRREWARDMLVYPAHYSSDQERRADRTVGAVLGELLNANEPLTIHDAAQFAQWIAARQAGFPQAYRRIKAINVRLRQFDEAEAEELEAGRNECAVG